ncbi:MAG: ribosome hibernation-promoting factor, HPF/YfiA family [Sciscionella sp.]
MDIVVKGRNIEVPEHYRVHVTDKLSRLERYDRKVIRFDVQLFHEPNRRQAKACQRVEITGKGKGPVVRAEACAGDFYAALDCAVNKLENRLRRAHDRRKARSGRKRPPPVAVATSGAMADVAPRPALIDGNAGGQLMTWTAVLDAPAPYDDRMPTDLSEIPEQRTSDDFFAGTATNDDDPYGPGRVVRRKEHTSKPMSTDQALYEMELVGHDFYLFLDATSGHPSVVYRRKGFDYGVIALA